ncbi:MAG: hypothetical protein QOK04_1164, partial [Solirubrobacteraceae bacterium]|nr:hypothetical protein [Solirubrobacteraceae bacterium]
MNPIRRRVVACLLALAGLAVVPAAADAAQFVVNSTAETGGSCPTPTTCTLPQAINDSNTTTGDDVIDFNLSLPATITLTGALPAINPTTSADKLSINGPGANLLTVTMDQTQCPINDPIFRFSRGTSTMSGLTVSGGCNTQSLEASGINNDSSSTLTLDKVIVDSNVGDANNAQAA